VGPVLRICRALDGMPLAFELAPPGCARSSRNRSQRGWATASGCSPARERVRRLAWLARRRRCTAAAGPVAECVGASARRGRRRRWSPHSWHGVHPASRAAAVCRPRGRSRRPGRHRPPSRHSRRHSEVGAVVLATDAGLVIRREADAFCCDSPTPGRTSTGGIRCPTVAVVREGPSPQRRPSSYRGRPV